MQLIVIRMLSQCRNEIISQNINLAYHRIDKIFKAVYLDFRIVIGKQ